MKHLLLVWVSETGLIEENKGRYALGSKKENRMTKGTLINVSVKAGIVEFAQELAKTSLGHYLDRWDKGCP